MIQSSFIDDILTLLLDGDEEGIEAKSQKTLISEAEHEYTGVGAFISFEHEPGIEKFRTKKDDLILTGVVIKSPELNIGADCTLFFSNGIIDYLEIWSFDGDYPKGPLKEYCLTQSWEGSPKRKIERRK